MSALPITRESRMHGHGLRSRNIPIRQRCRAGLAKQRIADQIKTTLKNGGYVPRAEEKVLHYSRKRTSLESTNLPWARLQYNSNIRGSLEHIPVSLVDLNMLPPEPFGPFDQRPPTPKKSCLPAPTTIYASRDLEPTGAPASQVDVLWQQLEGYHMGPSSGCWNEISSSRLRENCFGQIVLTNSWRQKVSVDFLSLLLEDCHIAMGDD